MSPLKYRADIDGLRAIAVLLVVAFHAFDARGGFLGVDMFFVISGFLITTILLENLKRGSFSFFEFYARRAKRIFPALTLVLAASLAFGWFDLLAGEYEALSKHTAGGAGFFANIMYWKESGYFDAHVDTKPLLHLWSLGIEEQFYLIWPVLLWSVWRLRLNLFLVTAALFLASFAWNVHRVQSGDTIGAFYQLQTRFWELLMGSALAYGLTFHSQKLEKFRRGRWADYFSFGGIVLIIPGILYTKDSAFPGWWALLPTLGTAALIFAGAQAWLNRRLLSLKPLVWVGLISFPLYLWHWPLLSFLRVHYAETPARELKALAAAAALLFAWLTYRYIERPCRESQARHLAPSLTALLAVIGLFGWSFQQQKGMPARLAANPSVVNEGIVGHDLFHQYLQKKFLPCSPVNLYADAPTWGDFVRCVQSKAGPIDLAIIGDSHAEHLLPGLAFILKDKNIVYYAKTSIPTISNPEYQSIYDSVLNDEHIKTVIISALWYLRQREVLQGSNLLEELNRTVSALKHSGKKVYITNGTPAFSFDSKRCKYAKRPRCEEDVSFFREQMSTYRWALRALVEKHSDVSILRTFESFCDGHNCSQAGGGKLFFRDNNHLNINGSKRAAEKILAAHPELAL